MTKRCEEGKKLLHEYSTELDKVTDAGFYTTDPNQPVLVTLRAWKEHYSTCEQCRKAESEAK